MINPTEAAFPTIDVRTYIATAALNGLLAADENSHGGFETLEKLAAYSARVADALIVELNKKATEPTP